MISTVVRHQMARRQDERGAVAIIVATSLTMLLVATAMVLDFGMVRLDRQQIKLAADSSVMSGLRAADAGTGQAFTFRGVCGALQFLKSNQSNLAGLPAGVCGSPPMGRVCSSAPSSHAVYTGTTTTGGVTTSVTIKMPYLVSDGGFPEESLPTLAADDGAANGCDQLGVIVTESRKPGLGSLATDSDLVVRQRSVGRVRIGDGDLSPALHLLEQTECSVLTVGSAGSPSRIKVFGSSVSDVPATIHSDSSATGPDCGSGSNQQLLQGKQDGGAVAFGNSTGLAGMITSVATANGVDPAWVSDEVDNVYGTTAPDEFTVGTTSTVTARGEVTRVMVDERYLGGVTAEVIDAFPRWDDYASLAPFPAVPSGYTHRFDCPTAAQMTTLAGLNSTHAVYINCAGSGITLDGTIGAGTIFFHGFIKNGNLRMPNATHVYIDNTNNAGNRDSTSGAVQLGTGKSFCIGASSALGCASLTDAGACPTSTTTKQTDLMIRRGALTSGGDGLVRLCNTRVISAGGQLGLGTSAAPGACLPTSNGTYLADPGGANPPCPGAADDSGTGQVGLDGETDWTAPNRYGDMEALGFTDAQKQAAWFAGEDLALWTESFGEGPAFKMAGGGLLNVAGVFMVPNADPFNVTGGGNQDLTDAQFVTRKFAVAGGAILTMRVDPYNSVTLPDLGPFLLVR